MSTGAHLYEPGDNVKMAILLPGTKAARGDYQVVRQLPEEQGEYRYRIKSELEQHERVVTESRLKPA